MATVRYEVWVRRGEKAGIVHPTDKKPILDLEAATALAADFVAQADEVVITEIRIVRRIPGKRVGREEA